MHFLFSNEGNRLVLDHQVQGGCLHWKTENACRPTSTSKVVLLTAGKELFPSPGSCREAFSDGLVYKTDQFYILYRF